jgi:hypothetical protein
MPRRRSFLQGRAGRGMRSSRPWVGMSTTATSLPARQGYVDGMAGWPRSTVHGSVERGVYPRVWANDPEADFDVGGRA